MEDKRCKNSVNLPNKQPLPNRPSTGTFEKRGQVGVPLKENYHNYGQLDPVTRITSSGDNPPPRKPRR